MSSPDVIRRATRALAAPLALLASLVTALAPAPARAQPACVAGTLSDYTTPGFVCRLGGFAFDEFRALLFTDATEGVRTFVTPAELSTVLPFTRVRPDGALAVGFEFLDLVASVSVTDSRRGDERGVAVAQVEFLAHALAPDLRLAGAEAELGVGIEGTEPGTTFSEALGFADVRDVRTSTPCLRAEVDSPPRGFRLESLSATCESASARELTILIGGIARLDRDHDDRPASLFGFSVGGAQRITLVTAQVVPEPSTSALALSGLLVVGGAAVGARTRGRRAGPPGET